MILTSDGRKARKAAKQNTAATTNGMAFGAKKFIPLLALGALAVGGFALYKKWALKRKLGTAGTISSAGSTASVSVAPSFSQRIRSRIPFIGRRRSLTAGSALNRYYKFLEFSSNFLNLKNFIIEIFYLNFFISI